MCNQQSQGYKFGDEDDSHEDDCNEDDRDIDSCDYEMQMMGPERPYGLQRMGP